MAPFTIWRHLSPAPHPSEIFRGLPIDFDPRRTFAARATATIATTAATTSATITTTATTITTITTATTTTTTNTINPTTTTTITTTTVPPPPPSHHHHCPTTTPPDRRRCRRPARRPARRQRAAAPPTSSFSKRRTRRTGRMRSRARSTAPLPSSPRRWTRRSAGRPSPAPSELARQRSASSASRRCVIESVDGVGGGRVRNEKKDGGSWVRSCESCLVSPHLIPRHLTSPLRSAAPLARLRPARLNTRPTPRFEPRPGVHR